MKHSCEANKCKGTRYNGTFFVCAICNSKQFAECLMGKEEVCNLLLSVEMVKIENNKYTLNTANAELAKQTFDSIFRNESTIKFVCDKCSVNKSHDVANQQNDNLSQENSQLKNEINEYKQTIERLNGELKEKSDLIQNLIDTNDSPDKINSDGKSKEKRNGESDSSLDEMHDVLLFKVNEMISSEIDKISQHITDECKKVKIICLKQMKKIDKKYTNEPDAQKENLQKENPFRSKTLNTSNKAVTFTSRKSNDDIISPDSNNNKSIHFNENLIPQTQTNENQNVNAMYMMHVSKFKIGTKKEYIVEHIMQNTTIIQPDEFIVEELRNPSSDFVSFKISTSSSEMYEEIKGIWSPHYVARDFRPNRINNSVAWRKMRPFQMQYNKYKPNYVNKNNHRNMKAERNQHYKNDYRRHTPMRSQERKNYESSKKSNDKNEQPNEQKPLQQTPQYIYIPYQQPLASQVQPAFFLQPQGQQRVMPPIQQTFQPLHHQNQPHAMQTL